MINDEETNCPDGNEHEPELCRCGMLHCRNCGYPLDPELLGAP